MNRHARNQTGDRIESRCVQGEGRGAHRAAQRRPGRRQRPAGELGGARLAQSQPLRISRPDLSDQSAPESRSGTSPAIPISMRCPQAPDHMVVLVPAAAVIDTLRRGAAAGARSATVFSAGFGEGFDAQAAALGRELAAVIARDRARRVGPELHGQCLRQEPPGHPDRGPSARGAAGPGRARRPERRHDDLHQSGAAGARHLARNI